MAVYSGAKGNRTDPYFWWSLYKVYCDTFWLTTEDDWASVWDLVAFDWVIKNLVVNVYDNATATWDNPITVYKNWIATNVTINAFQTIWVVTNTTDTVNVNIWDIIMIVCWEWDWNRLFFNFSYVLQWT